MRVRVPPSALNPYFLTLEFNIGLKIDEFIIIDLETTSLKPKDGEIITFGIIFDDKLISMTRTKNISYEKFLKNIKKTIENFLDKKVYAYNAEFEKSWIKEHLNLELNFKDLMDNFKNFKPKLREAFPVKFPRIFGIKNFDISNREVLDYWQRYINEDNEKYLHIIIWHNVYDLITELNFITWLKVFPNLENFHSHYRCDKCLKEFNSYNELAYIQYKLKVEDKYELFEKDICLNCLKEVI